MLGYYKMSIIGTAHQAEDNGVCQDASDVTELPNGWIAAAVADGLGSAKRSDIGSNIAVKTVLNFISENYPDQWHEESLISLLRTAYHKALKEIKVLSLENQGPLSDYDTTLTTVIYNGVNVVFGHVGDGGVISLSPYGDYSVLTTAQKGEMFNETNPLRAGPDSWVFGASKEDACAITMMTDGIFDIACPWLLAKSNQPIYINYIRSFMDISVLKVSTPADFENAQSEIIEFFSDPSYKQITDDKTIVGIINTEVNPEPKPDVYYTEPDWERLAKEHHDKLYSGKMRIEPVDEDDQKGDDNENNDDVSCTNPGLNSDSVNDLDDNANIILNSNKKLFTMVESLSKLAQDEAKRAFKKRNSSKIFRKR
jgi:hypothetical protein